MMGARSAWVAAYVGRQKTCQASHATSACAQSAYCRPCGGERRQPALAISSASEHHRLLAGAAAAAPAAGVTAVAAGMWRGGRARPHQNARWALIVGGAADGAHKHQFHPLVHESLDGLMSRPRALRPRNPCLTRLLKQPTGAVRKVRPVHAPSPDGRAPTGNRRPRCTAANPPR